MKQSLIITAIIVAAVAGSAGFFGGTKYQQKKASATLGRNAGVQGQRTFAGGNRNGFRPVAGEIMSVDGGSITVKLQDGSSKIVVLSDKTQINKAESATRDDLKTGETVAVFGQENSDGSVTAQNIQLNPQTRLDQPQNQP